MAELIGYQDVIDNTPIQGDGADKVKKLEASIKFAGRQLKAILCDTTYDAMVAAYNGGSPTAAQTALYPYCLDFMVWVSFKSYLGFSQHTDTDAGFRVFTENTSIEAKPFDISGLEKNADQFAAGYKTELETFLALNDTTYPDWAASPCNTCRKKIVSLGITGAGRKNARNSMDYSRTKIGW